jgi:chemotaxis-related protein WspD
MNGQPQPASTSGASRLLDREAPADYVREWTERIAAEKKVVDAGTTSVLIFRVGLECLALPTSIFQEVAEECPVHSLPHHLGGILVGLVNIRGELLICFSLEALLSLEKPADEKKETARRVYHRLLVVNRSGDRLAFPVDEVYCVHRYHPRELRAVPDTLSRKTATYTLGILPWQNRTVGCLDDQLLFYTLNKGFS